MDYDPPPPKPGDRPSWNTVLYNFTHCPFCGRELRLTEYTIVMERFRYCPPCLEAWDKRNPEIGVPYEEKVRLARRAKLVQRIKEGALVYGVIGTGIAIVAGIIYALVILGASSAVGLIAVKILIVVFIVAVLILLMR